MRYCVQAWIDRLPHDLNEFDTVLDGNQPDNNRLKRRAYDTDDDDDDNDKASARSSDNCRLSATGDGDGDGPPRKRPSRPQQRHVRFSLPYNMPVTPSASGSKRSLDDNLDDGTRSQADVDITPKPKRNAKSRESRNVTRNVLDLDRLEKPFNPPPRLNITSLATDVQDLHKKIKSITSFRNKIIPDTVRANIEKYDDTEFPEHCFYPDQRPLLNAASDFMQLCDIVHASRVSRKLQRHEHGWNNLVHTRVLSLAFGSSPKNVPGLWPGSVAKPVSVRLEPMMAATIMYNWVPRLNPVSKAVPDTQQQLASSVSGGESLMSASTGSVDRQSEPPVPTELQHTRANSKKVDYVLALDLASDTPLHRVLRELMDREQAEARRRGGTVVPIHVNQTMYEPVRDSLIAVSIETKREGGKADDPLHQLGIWSCAWHKRMMALRLLRGLDLLSADTDVAPGSAANTSEQTRVPVSRPTLVSLPLIVARGEQWEIYYACDHTHAIEVFGPFTLGSTDTLLNTYVLLASLKAIEDWVEDVFYPSMEQWFQSAVP